MQTNNSLMLKRSWCVIGSAQQQHYENGAKPLGFQTLLVMGVSTTKKALEMWDEKQLAS